MNLFTGHISKRGLHLASRLQLPVSSGASNTSSKEIQIPMRIERGPTDILRALERTIKRDPTAPRYKYHDDPYLIPVSNMQKRTFALAEESGRRAAMWIREQHSNLFEHREADPIIKDFLPKEVYTEKANVTEDTLKNVIRDGHRIDALTIYKLLDENVSIETKLELLQLLCYYNNEMPITGDFVGERWFKNMEKRAQWQECPDTNKLFNFLIEVDTKTASEAYSIMICGYSKFLTPGKVWKLYGEVQQNKYSLSSSAYNAVINTISALKDSTDSKGLLIKTLQQMKNDGVQPNVDTLNSALRVPFTILNRAVAEDLCRALFVEFKSIGVKPSLGSYNYALKIFYRKDAQRNSLLREIITEIKNDQFVMTDKSDLFFFLNAMEIAANNLEDSHLGDEIHKLLLAGDNYNFIGDGFKESIYYRHYLTLHVRNNALDEFVKNYYDLIVPNIYTPEPSVMDSILNAVESNDSNISRDLLPRFWTHIVQFDQLQRKNLVAKALYLMRTHCQPPEESELNKTFANAAWTVWLFINKEQEKRIQKISWSGTILCDIAILCFRANEYEKCSKIISTLLNERDNIIGIPEQAQIEELFKGFFSGCHVDEVVNLVDYCSQIGYEDTTSMVVEIFSNLSLNEWQENRIRSLVDPSVLTTAVGKE